MKRFILWILAFGCLIAPAFAASSLETLGPVKACDDLWQIAQSFHQQHAQYTPSQIMLAIVQKNPQAFFHQNINGLLQGHPLTLPSASEIKKISAHRAAQKIVLQNEQWKKILKDIQAHPNSFYQELRRVHCPLVSTIAPGSKPALASIREPAAKPASRPSTAPLSDPTLATLTHQIEQLTEENATQKQQLQAVIAEKEALEKQLAGMTTSAGITTNAGMTAKAGMTATIAEKMKSSSLYQKINSWLDQIGQPLFFLIMGSIALLLLIIILWGQDRKDKKRKQKRTIPATKAPMTKPSSSEEVVALEPLAGEEVNATKLDLARAYIDMDEHQHAENMLKKILQRGSESDKLEAKRLLDELKRRK